jgi:hypothetical protein
VYSAYGSSIIGKVHTSRRQSMDTAAPDAAFGWR